MGERALVLSSDPWSMKDENTGKELSGYSIWFLNRYREETGEIKGYKPSKVSVSSEVFKQFQTMKLPSVCELDFGSRPGQQGKATLTVVAARHVVNINLDNIFNPTTQGK